MDTRIKFLYLSEPDMIKAGVKNMDQCVEAMEDLLVTLNKGDYVMAGVNHNSHGAQVIFPDDPQFEGMPKNADDRRFMAMPAYLGGKYQMAGMKWYGSNCENKASGLPRSILMMLLNDKDTGAPLALMSANLVSCYRTGAIPGVGAKYLAGKDSETVTIIGPGVMGRTCLLAFLSVCPKITTVKVKGRGQRSLHAFEEFVKKECPQIQQVIVCDSMEEAVKDSDIICVTSTAPVKEIDFPYIAEDWVKKGALICLPSAARFDDDFLINRCKKVVDNYKLYEAWAEEFPYPSYEMVQIIGSKFTDYLHEGRIQREDIVDIADIINKKHPGRESDDEIIVYSVGGMPVEDIAWGGTVYRNALKEGIGVELPLWDQPDMA
ncbi:MAG: tyramine oxidase subunit B [Roseburia faecis]|nr:tyramine oxidase subunit B [Roseburia faecis]MDY4476610.1 tyramine oxidase subunit B [Roseburia faecis]MDY6243655.1 tyramine oxidase subunit B [Lachnospiraceae bacterium]MDY6361402.1 tyramine oxidase subunit B [Lachnospiraceae bacterium]